jgi:antitoxin MazE
MVYTGFEMIVHTKIQKWGNGLALRVSGGMRDIPHFEAGTKVEVEIFEEGFSVKKSLPKKEGLFPYNESELLDSLTPKTAHADLLTNPVSSEIE